ncbi:MAG TPA: Holliday junction resolvase RuvX [Bacillota bacterium]|nr:Holliday junction resolvase RuvX [Bacillota bacterium]HOL10659.1 Holliday junction resolvase RuvX [Bacillota bacterium]HPO98062.1 Holliday junction resolvase RuvX [Bacillota bacterium]
MRWMGLDIGQKRIGVAISDPLEITAQGVTVRQRTTLDRDLDFFCNLINERQVEGIVIGLPVNMNGTEGPMAEKVRSFGEKLATRSGVTTVYWDERLSTASAQRLLIEADVSRSRRKQTVDQMAAAIILQNYLDSVRNKGNNQKILE